MLRRAVLTAATSGNQKGLRAALGVSTSPGRQGLANRHIRPYALSAGVLPKFHLNPRKTGQYIAGNVTGQKSGDTNNWPGTYPGCFILLPLLLKTI